MLLLSAWILCSIPVTLLAPTITAGSDGAPVTSPAILLMVRAVKAPLFLTCSYLALRRTPDTTHMLVMSDGNDKVAALWFFMTQSWILFSMMLPTSIGNLLTRTHRNTNLSCETVVVCVVGISLDFSNFTHTLEMGVKSILLITHLFSLAHDIPFTVSVVKILFHLCGVNLSSNLPYSQLTSAGKL